MGERRLELIDGVTYLITPDGQRYRYADVMAFNNPGMQYDDATGEPLIAVPERAEDPATPSAPTPREYSFGDVGSRTLRRAVEDVSNIAGSGGEVTRSLLPEDWQQTFPDAMLAAGDYGLAGLTGLLGAVETGAGYAGEVGDAAMRGLHAAVGAPYRYAPGDGARALQRDLMSMFEAAGAAPEGRMLGAVAEAARPAVARGVMDFAADESGALTLPPLSNAQKTQIAGTFPTYQKALGVLDAVAPGGRSIDFGAGLGMSRDLGFDTFEPFPRAGFDPTYRSAADIPDASYDRLTNLNVLNVVPREIRDGIVEDIGRVIRPGGAGVITTRGRDVLGAKGAPGPEPMSVITSADTYQKGFTQSELQDYLRYMLGQNFDVSPLRLGPAGALIQRTR
jgi:hypothetical protein